MNVIEELKAIGIEYPIKPEDITSENVEKIMEIINKIGEVK